MKEPSMHGSTLLFAWGITMSLAAIQASAFPIDGDDPQRHGGEPFMDAGYYYTPVTGKHIGISIGYQHRTLENFTKLKQRYGIVETLVDPDTNQYQSAIVAGYSVDDLLVSIWNDYIQQIDEFPAGGYFIDEPEEHDCSGHSTTHLYTPEEMALRQAYIQTRRPGSEFVITGYKRCSHNRIAAAYVDVIMYSAYQNWDEFSLPICHVNMGWGDEYERPWIPGNQDQRNSWTSMRNVFGTKFSKSWVTAAGDEYANLLQHATALGLSAVWIYDPYPFDSTFFESFCDIAWQNGWLNRLPIVPLPIQLSSFTGTVLPNQHVLLEWTTLSEINNYGFEVQSKPGGATDFESIPNSFVPGHGTTNVPHYYSFIDSSAHLGQSWYRLKQIDLDGSIHYSDPIRVDVVTTVGMAEPNEFALQQNHPNPFNPTTTIKYTLSSQEKAGVRSQHVTLKVFDVLGREVATLVNEEMRPGRYEQSFDGGNLASGVYFYRLQSGRFVETRKLLLLR
jgi:hypothetical protein